MSSSLASSQHRLLSFTRSALHALWLTFPINNRLNKPHLTLLHPHLPSPTNSSELTTSQFRVSQYRCEVYRNRESNCLVQCEKNKTYFNWEKLSEMRWLFYLQYFIIVILNYGHDQHWEHPLKGTKEIIKFQKIYLKSILILIYVWLLSARREERMPKCNKSSLGLLQTRVGEFLSPKRFN